MTAAVRHAVRDGFCTVCGEPADWLLERGAVVVEAEPPPVAGS